MKFLKLVLTFYLFIGLYGCKVEDSADVNQDKIWTGYELLYDANDSLTIAVAQFRIGGETGDVLELSQDASVTFNGVELMFNSGYAGHAMEFEGRVDSGTFAYHDLDAFTFENTVMIIDTIAFPEDFDTIVKTQTNTLVWRGTPLAANEQVGLLIGNWKWGDAAQYVQDEENATDIAMDAAQLSSIPVGPTTVYMDRWTDVPVAEGTSKGGNVVAKYRAVKENIQVIN